MIVVAGLDGRRMFDRREAIAAISENQIECAEYCGGDMVGMDHP